ncbi:hypothetical protein Gotri_026216 [Gossypium trilobum]|uniref:Uncharacterized protein n=1 Tax=Gossypium trilobum TaxID=34281 RepID=A0A7J9FMW5_9ROSI|nr:hypothetical protein [Gossypium trilobum]
MILKRAGVDVKEMAGFVYNPLTGRWSLSDDISTRTARFSMKDSIEAVYVLGIKIYRDRLKRLLGLSQSILRIEDAKMV